MNLKVIKANSDLLSLHNTILWQKWALSPHTDTNVSENRTGNLI